MQIAPRSGRFPTLGALGGSQGGIQQDRGCLVIAPGSKAQMHVDILPHTFNLGPSKQQRGRQQAVAGQGWVALPAPATHSTAGWDTSGLGGQSQDHGGVDTASAPHSNPPFRVAPNTETLLKTGP